MLALALGLIGFVGIVLLTAAWDRIGLGLLFSSSVDGVADARLAEPALGIPPLYVVACAVAGAGAIIGLADCGTAARWGAGVLVASFLLLTLWDLRRRRGALAVYIRLRRDEIGFVPRGEVIEVPKLVFLVMNQPTPLVWLLTAAVLAALGAALFPVESWAGMLPLIALSAALVWLWLRNRRSPWEPLARRLRWLSLRSGDRLVELLQHALDLDPEVMLLRAAANAAVARFMAKDH